MSTQIHPTAYIEEGAILGNRVRVGAFSIIHANASLGDDCIIDSHCVIGRTEVGQAPKPLLIGAKSQIRSHTVIYGGSSFGPGLTTGHQVTIREGTEAGLALQVGTLGDLQGNMKIGDYVRLHSNVFLPKGTSLADFVWIFPHVVFTDDPHPPSDGNLAPVKVGRYSAIGAHSVILPGVEIGEDCLVGAGSVLRKSLPSGRVAAGNPARDIGASADIQLRDGSGPAYPWRRHFHRGYPEEIVANWKAENPS